MNNISKFLIYLAPIFLFASTSFADGAELEIGLSYWFTQGKFDMTGGPPDAANTWNLNHPVDSNIVILIGEVRFLPRLSLDISYGFGGIKEATITDTDYDVNGIISDLSYSTSSGDTNFYTFNGYVRVWGEGKKYLDISGGYLYLKNSVDYRNPRIAISNYLPSTLSWEEVWLEYDLIFKGVRVGIRGGAPLFHNLSIKGSAGYIPWLDADYDGLRYPERPPSQQQPEKIAADGTAIDAEIAGSYTPIPHLAIDLGYRYIYFKAEGQDSPGTAWAYSWEQLKTNFKGAFLRLNYAF